MPIASHPPKHLSTCLTFKLKQPCGFQCMSRHRGAPRHGQNGARAVLAKSLAFIDCTYGRKSFKAAQQVAFKTIRPTKRNQYNLLLTTQSSSRVFIPDPLSCSPSRLIQDAPDAQVLGWRDNPCQSKAM